MATATMTPTNSAQVYVDLVNLRNTAGESLYIRLTLANKLLSDREWVESPTGGGGDESRAIDRLEDTAFGDLCGALTLPQMLEVLHRIPQQNVWKSNKYNLRMMHAEMQARAQAARPRTASNVPNPTTPEEQVKRLKLELKERAEEIRLLRAENRKLKDAVWKLQEALVDLQIA